MNQNRNKRRKNSKKTLVIGGFIFLGLILAGVIGYKYWAIENRKSLAHETATAFIDALEKQDYQQLTDKISVSSLNEINYTKEKVQERYETIYTGIGVNDITAENISVTENEVTNLFELKYDLSMKTSLGELSQQSYQVDLIEDNGGFAVDWNTQLLFPEMEPEDTVRMNLSFGERGSLLDREGKLLAGESPVWQAGLYPALLGEEETYTENLETIAGMFETTTEHLENVLSASWVTDESFVPFKIVNEGETPEISGVVYQQTTARSYPLGEAGAHLIGYIGEVSAEDIEKKPSLQVGDVIGKSGLEAAFDSRLRGNQGGKITILDSEGEEKMVLQETLVKDGEDIILTINASLQQEYYEQLSNQSGAAVVTDPSSGELLVLTSSPSYNPTLMSRGISVEAYQEYAENEESPFLPRYSARYAPGSTFKAITAAIGLDEGVTTLEKSHIISGYQWQKDESWGSYQVTRVSAHPTEVHLEDALVYSDNIFFAKEVTEMGAEIFMDGLLKFPFGEDFKLPISMQPAQITNSGSFENEGLLADTSFGQGELLMSPLHQAIFYGTFANGGYLIYPKIEMIIENTVSTQPVTKEAAETVNRLLVEVVENPNGTAHVLKSSRRTLAAKTGTTEIQADVVEDGNDTNGFLVAYDAEQGTFLSVIMVEDDSGSNVARTFSPLLTQH